MSKTPPAHTSTITNPLEASLNLQRRPRMHKRSPTGYLDSSGAQLNEVFPPESDPKVWKQAMAKNKHTHKMEDIAANVVDHLTTTLARAPFNADDLSMYQSTALAVRDELITRWNKTQTHLSEKPTKRVYYLSLEFLMGRTLDNALLNLDAKKQYSESIKSLGFNMEDLIDSERDQALGNGGLGRLAACYLDSATTTEIPCWGYGLRYEFGIFQQAIRKETGEQIELPDPWLESANPWEIPRLDTAIEIRFYGEATRTSAGKNTGAWTGGQLILAVPYDCPIPGWKTENVNNLRLWAAKSKRAFNLDAFNQGDYQKAVEESNDASLITRVLYPSENTMAGKELRLKQQAFWCAASLSDILRRFKKLKLPWSDFSNYNAIQLNDTHPTIAIVELQRVLVDEENVPWDEAWDIVVKTFAYTNHTVLPEALEKWPVELMSTVLPRHMAIIFDINLAHLQAVEKKFPNDRDRLGRMSIIEEGGNQQVRMAFLAVVGTHKVNGVAALHSRLVVEMFKDFADFYGRDRFTNVTNGITFRRWLLQCNPDLASLITSKIGDGWIGDATKLKDLEKFAADKAFQKAFYDCKLANKARLAAFIEEQQGRVINRKALFDIQVKRIHLYKRQTLNIFGCIYRYLELKKMTPEQRKKVVPRVALFAGKAAPGYYAAKQVIRLINNVGRVIDEDNDIPKDVYQVCFLPDYSVSLAELLIPAADISEHISTAGTEASGTSNMKFALNGAPLIGTKDGASIEIAEEVGEENVFFFGHETEEIDDLRHKHMYNPEPMCEELKEVFDAIRSGMFGDAHIYESLLNECSGASDFYCLSDDFLMYLGAQNKIDEAFSNKQTWLQKCILNTARMGKFSSDRCILQYAEEIWNAEAVTIPPSDSS